MESPSTIPTAILYGGLALITLYLFRNYRSLSHIPGPFIATFSNFTRLHWIWARNAHQVHVALHKKYGKLVRIGPNMVSVGDPSEIAHIYGFDDTFMKVNSASRGRQGIMLTTPLSDFYGVILPYNNGKVMPGLISSHGELHRSLKRPVSNIYSMSNLVSFESFVDSTIVLFCDVLEKRYLGKTESFDFSFWLQAFVFDTLGELTFSKRYGFIEEGKDVKNIMADIWAHFERVSLVGQIPWIDTVLRINPLLSKYRPKPISPIAKFAVASIQERKSREEKYESQVNSRDLLSRFLVAQTQSGAPPFATMTWISGNITAGSDTTAIVLRSIFYYLLKNPSTLQTLKNEIATAGRSGLLSEPPTWQETQNLRYLDACTKEALRIHPPVGMHLERVVPKKGSVICGEYLAAGTKVGINAWVVHRDVDIFGEDADEWRPERWIDCTDEQRLKMDKAMFAVSQNSLSLKHDQYLT